MAPCVASPSGAGTSAGGLALSLLAWSAILILFIWFAGLVHIDGGSLRISWSEIGTTRAPAADGLVVAQYWGRSLGIGPYDGVILAAVRCLAIGIAAGGAIAIMRLLVVPLAWGSAMRGEQAACTRACANAMCARIMAALVATWILFGTILFAAAAVVPPAALGAVQIAGRAGVGAILLLGPSVLLSRQVKVASRMPGFIEPRRGAPFAAMIQFLCGTALVVLLALIGSVLTLQ